LLLLVFLIRDGDENEEGEEKWDWGEVVAAGGGGGNLGILPIVFIDVVFFSISMSEQ